MLKFIVMMCDGFENPVAACPCNIPLRVMFDGATRLHRIHLDLVSVNEDGTVNISGVVYGNLEIDGMIVAIDAEVNGTVNVLRLEGQVEVIHRRTGIITPIA